MEDKTWRALFMVIPVVLGSSLAKILAPDDQMGILYAALFGGGGAMLGAGIFYIIKDTGKGIKFTSLLGVFFAGIVLLYFLSSEPTDKEILEKKWLTQTIGEVEFETPQKLKLQTSEVPESFGEFYKKNEIYSDGNRNRITLFINSNLITDTISIVNAYSSTLEVMLQKQSVNLDNFELIPFSSDDNEISALFSFDLNGEKVNGYGFMYKKGYVLESIWLLPIKRGFSKEYIEGFEAGISIL